jgi:hypothetical protein
MDRQPAENPPPHRRSPRATPGRLACALPFLLGVAIVLILLVLFFYLLVI